MFKYKSWHAEHLLLESMLEGVLGESLRKVVVLGGSFQLNESAISPDSRLSWNQAELQGHRA